MQKLEQKIIDKPKRTQEWSIQIKGDDLIKIPSSATLAWYNGGRSIFDSEMPEFMSDKLIRRVKEIPKDAIGLIYNGFKKKQYGIHYGKIEFIFSKNKN